MISNPLLAFGELQGGHFTYDFQAFMHRGGAKLSPLKSVDELARRRSGPIQKGRIELVRALHEAYLERKEAGAAQITLGSTIVAIRMFWRFCDAQDLRFRGTAFLPVQRAISSFATDLVAQYRKGRLQERTAGQIAWSALGLLAGALDLSSVQLIGRTTMPRVNPGTQACAHEKLDLAVVDAFLKDLRLLIASLSDRMFGSFPIRIDLSDDKTFLYFGFGPKPVGGVHSFKGWNAKRIEKFKLKNADISFERRQPIIQLRVQAECLRFIEATAMNLAQVLELTVGQIEYQSYSGEYELSGFKHRAGHDIVVRISKPYRPAFDRYLEFRRKIFGSHETLPLFPFFGREGSQSKYVATRGFRSLQRIFQSVDRKFVPPSLLRFAKGQRVIRLAATGGDLAAVSSVLQNTVEVVMRSYLVGSQQMATIEFLKFLKVISERRARHQVRVGGDCKRPDKPQAIPGLSEGSPSPDCINPAGCFFCQHYRGVKSKEYLHRILSYRAFLRLRSGMSASSTVMVDEVVIPTIERINDFVEEVAGSSERLRHESEEIVEAVDNGDYHRSWSGWIELLAIAGGNNAIHVEH
ncbi:MAG TPA: hypothetical protein VMR06_01130 [Dokdonella sp.]|uniref:hypothetical protein n=1 Tax=Dokdonella sp. TaxID=2291710 RepID=UPI002C90E298|nr:hypothetical protein [Dokdonella sp.]HUD40581.1 hypothetical protein [Dokdonella sp.]